MIIKRENLQLNGQRKLILHPLNMALHYKWIKKLIIASPFVFIILTAIYTNTPSNDTTFNKSINIQVTSSEHIVLLVIDDQIVYSSTNRGIHLLVLHQSSGHLMAQQVFDTYLPFEDESIITFIDDISPGRILIFAIKDEGTSQLGINARNKLLQVGSTRANDIDWRDTWVMISKKDGQIIGEIHNKNMDIYSWASDSTLITSVDLVQSCRFKDKREIFCDQYEGYGQLCNCITPAPITFTPINLTNNKVYNVPVIIIASDRPRYLYRHLQSVLSCPGVNKKMIRVFIDGFHQETLQVTKLFGVKALQHSSSEKSVARVSQHYELAFTTIFKTFPDVNYIIVLEDDLLVSPDFFHYFSQTLHLLDDDDVYCISAWNDLGYNHSCKDPTLMYRIEGMPGLGWILKKKLFIQELQDKWPIDSPIDWDLWMRSDPVRKNRECIIPDISRTYHFGIHGVNVKPLWQKLLFNNHSFNQQFVKEMKGISNLRKNNYQFHMKKLISKAKVLNGNKSICDPSLVPDTQGHLYVIYIKMQNSNDFQTWLKFAKCAQIWFLDARGYHKSTWRLWIKSNHILLIGSPASPYSKFKPKNTQPLS